MKKLSIFFIFVTIFLSTSLYSQGGDALIGLHNLSELGRMMQEDDDPVALTHIENVTGIDIDNNQNQLLLTKAESIFSNHEIEAFSFGLPTNTTFQVDGIQEGINRTVEGISSTSYSLFSFVLNEDITSKYDVYFSFSVPITKIPLEKQQSIESVVNTVLKAACENENSIVTILSFGLDELDLNLSDNISSYTTATTNNPLFTPTCVHGHQEPEFETGNFSDGVNAIIKKYSPWRNYISPSGKIIRLPTTYTPVFNQNEQGVLWGFYPDITDETIYYRSIVYKSDHSELAGYGYPKKIGNGKVKYERFIYEGDPFIETIVYGPVYFGVVTDNCGSYIANSYNYTSPAPDPEKLCEGQYTPGLYSQIENNLIKITLSGDDNYLYPTHFDFSNDGFNMFDLNPISGSYECPPALSENQLNKLVNKAFKNNFFTLNPFGYGGLIMKSNNHELYIRWDEDFQKPNVWSYNPGLGGWKEYDYVPNTSQNDRILAFINANLKVMKDLVPTTLEALSMSEIPFVSQLADITLGGIYIAKGEAGNATLSFAGVILINGKAWLSFIQKGKKITSLIINNFGNATAVIKNVKNLNKTIDQLKSAGKLSDEAADLLKHEAYSNGQLLDFLVQNPNDGVKAWKGLFTAPDFIRRNVTILGKADELLAAGFTKVDLDFLSGTVNKLKNRNIPNADLEKLTEYALEARKHTDQYSGLNIETDLFKQIDELASSTKFKNPEDLKPFMSEQQLLQNIADNPGNLEALNEAVRVLKNGDEVLLEGKGILKGDIVNVTKTESIQYKAFTGTGPSTTTTNLKKAADQFNTELAAAGYKKIAKLKILESGNPQFSNSVDQLRLKLQQYMDANATNAIGDNLRALDQIRIDNATGLHKFRVENTLVVIVP